MRILLASYFYLPHVGGLWTYVDNLQKMLRKMGHEVDVFGHTPDMLQYYMVGSGRMVNKEKIKEPIYRNMIHYYLRERIELSEWIRWREIERYSYEAAMLHFGIGKYDFIHTQDIVSTRAIWRIKPKHTPMMATIHGCLATEFLHAGEVKSKQTQEWKYSRAEEHYGASSSHLTVVPTKWLKQLLCTEFGVHPRNIRVIPYGMDTERFMQQANENVPIPQPKSKKVIVCPARLVPVKGHKTLLEALAMLKTVRNDWVCLLLGDGSLRQELEQMVLRAGLHGDVQFWGSRSDVAAILKQADLMVLPSLQDNQPFSVMEAQVLGKPVVVSDAGGIPEMVRHGVTGLVHKKGDSRQLAVYLEAVLSNDALRENLGRNAKQYASEQWALQTMMGRTLNAYSSLMKF